MYVDVTLTRSKVKVKVTGLLNFRQLAKLAAIIIIIIIIIIIRKFITRTCSQALSMTAAPLRGFLMVLCLEPVVSPQDDC